MFYSFTTPGLQTCVLFRVRPLSDVETLLTDEINDTKMTVVGVTLSYSVFSLLYDSQKESLSLTLCTGFGLRRPRLFL